MALYHVGMVNTFGIDSYGCGTSTHAFYAVSMKSKKKKKKERNCHLFVYGIHLRVHSFCPCSFFVEK